MKTLTIFIFICLFIILRPYQMQATGLVYTGDDYSYFAHATSIAYGQFPSYKKEFYTNGDTMPMHSIGPGLMAAPFVFCFSLIDKLSNSSIVIQRTKENIASSWSLFGFVFATSLYFWLACFLLYKGLKIYFNHRCALISVVLMVLCQGLPLFAFRRPVFSHAYEFFLQSSMIYILLKTHAANFLDSFRNWKLVGIGIIAGLIGLVRANNIPAALFWPLTIVLFTPSPAEKKAQINIHKMLILPYISFLILYACFKLVPDTLNHSIGYRDATLLLLSTLPSASFCIKHFLHILFGIDWGLIFTAPFLLIGTFALFKYRFPLKGPLLVCLIPMLLNLYISIILKIHGGWYGYRLLVTSLIPIMIYPFAIMLQNLQITHNKKAILFLFLIAILPVLSMLSFEGNTTNLTLTTITESFGGTDWGNNTYQMEIWKTLIFHPNVLFIAIFKGGTLYLLYLISTLLRVTHMLPAIITDKYANFNISILIKTLLLYALPFLLYQLTKKISAHPPKLKLHKL